LVDTGYSQLPVTDVDGHIVGVISWQSFGKRVGELHAANVNVVSLKVKETDLEKARFIDPDTHIDTWTDWSEIDHVLVGSKDSLLGVLSVSHVLGRLNVGGPVFSPAVSPVLRSAPGGACRVRCYPGSAHVFDACGVRVVFTCTSVQAAERAECVRRRRNRVRRSRRPWRMHACDADSTGITLAGMKRPAFGAGVTERWSGVRHGSDRRQLQDYVLVRRASRFSGGTVKAVSDGGRADWA